MRELTVSFGEQHLAKITEVRQMRWEEFAGWLVRRPDEVTDKAARGWYIPGTFSPAYRDGDNFKSRDAITFDFDHVEVSVMGSVLEKWGRLTFAVYTTFSHTPEKPRFRVVMPLARSVTYDEYQAISRRLAAEVGIEWVARETFVPTQMMFCPTVKPGAEHFGQVNHGNWLDPDGVLAEYFDWTDATEWPRRAEGDPVHNTVDGITPPREKPGVVGQFCRAFDCVEAISRFELPYSQSANGNRWTYTAGSRPEGVIVYDDGQKIHSHHDTDPARGQQTSFDLVRLHRFSELDPPNANELPMAERPSYQAMVEFARALPELKAAEIEDFSVIEEPAEEPVKVPVPPEDPFARFEVIDPEDFVARPPPEWIIRNVLPRAELVVLYGESGSGKSFLALDMMAAITRGVEWRGKKVRKGRVVYVCAEGAAGFQLRVQAYAEHNKCAMSEMPSIIASAPNFMDPEQGAAVCKKILKWADKRRTAKDERAADAIVIDTLAAVIPGANENAGQDMGKLIEHCKYLHRKTGAVIFIIHHSGKDAAKGARGWSGIRAAVDAELEVVRDGNARQVRVTKQKDGEDGAIFGFTLGRRVFGLDDDDEEIVSMYVQHDEDTPVESMKKLVAKQRPRGSVETVVLSTLKLMAPFGTVDLSDLTEGAVKTLPKDPSGKDRRRANIRRALEGLVAKNLAFMHPNDRVSLSATVSTQESDTSWLS